MVSTAFCIITYHHHHYHRFWHALLGVLSTKCRYQSSEWMILSHVSCFFHGEIIVFQFLLDSLHPCSTRMSWWSPPVLQGRDAVKISMEDRLGICFIWHSCNAAEHGETP